MNDFVSLLRGLLRDGRIVLRSRPQTANEDESLAVLRCAFDDYRLTVAGPLLDLDTATVLTAARFLANAAWFLGHCEEAESELEKALAFAEKPRTAAQHLSADLLFRYLPVILKRARALGAGDRLAAIVTDVLRHWPLSGVLADIAEEPATPLDFAGHRGLQLLYAERLAQHFKPTWVPEESLRGYLELVWTELGRDPGLLATPGPVENEEVPT